MLSLFKIANIGRGNIYKVPPEVRRKYGYLYDEEVRKCEDGGLAFHSGRLWNREGIHVLYVKGDRLEMAFQHGRLLRREIADGSLVQASKISANGIRNSVGNDLLAGIIGWYVRKRITEPILHYGISRVAEDLKLWPLAEGYGLSEGSGVPLKTLISAALGAETSQVLVGKIEDGMPLSFANNCSSFTAWGSATRHGKMITGRNTDYPLNGYFDRHPTVIYYDPTDASKKYMTVTSAGFHNAGVVGLNDAGIYLDIHTVVSEHVSPQGMPAFMVGQQTLRQAGTFDEALEMLTRFQPAAGWNYHVVSVKENKVATVEMVNDHTAVRRSRGEYHVTTNHWLEPEMEKRLLHLNKTVDEDTTARMERIVQMLEETTDGIDAKAAAAILGDKVDPRHRRPRPFTYTVAAPITVSSSVWIPEDGRLYLANGRAPVSLNTFVEFPTVDAFDPETFAAQAYDTFDGSNFKFEYPQAYEAEQLYIEARKAYEFHDDAATAIDFLQKAVAADDSEPALHLMLGLMAVRAQRMDIAKTALDTVLGFDFDSQRQRLARYVRGRIRAHEGDVAGALENFRAVEEDAETDAKLRRAVQQSEKKLRRKGRLPLPPKDIAIMMLLPDAYRYVGLLSKN